MIGKVGGKRSVGVESAVCLLRAYAVAMVGMSKGLVARMPIA